MDNFLPNKDALSQLIQSQCVVLYQRMQHLSVQELGLSEHGQLYFGGSHLKRLFFSIQTSAHLLYNAIKISQKNVADIVLMDYGAGVGSLYILAKLIGCKQVIYNDILEEWKNNALIIAKAIDIDVDEYIVGDIDTTLKELAQKGIGCNIITSRNVLEHIYTLEAFYKAIHLYQPNAIVYSSTTANFYNPVMNIQHVVLHRKVEKVYLQQRYQIIEQLVNHRLLPKEIKRLASRTKGHHQADIKQAITRFLNSGMEPAPRNVYTNTCDTTYGVWAENILPFSVHAAAAELAEFTVQFKPGFWDTHYTNIFKNWIGKFCNPLIKTNKHIGFVLAPFVYIIAFPNKNMQ